MAKSKEANDDKSKTIKSAIEEIQERFGEGSIRKFSESPRSDVDAVSTGCLSLDIALGIGGIPRGRVPAIGLTVTSPSSKRVKISGEEPAT